MAGSSLKDDLKAALNNTVFSDVNFICSDGVVVHASRLLLAMRSDMLRNMLCGHMREANSAVIRMPEISSVQFTIVLEYCYTEETTTLSLDSVVEAFKAAEFFLLPHLQNLICSYTIDNLYDHDTAGKLLSKAVANLETNADDNILFGVLRQFFLNKKLVEGQLSSLSVEALEVLVADINTNKNCPTSAFDLLKCIIDWAFRAVGRDEMDKDRTRLLNYLNNVHVARREAPSNHGVSSESIEEIGRVLTSVIRMIRFEAMCPHQLAVVTDTLTFVPYNILCIAFRRHIDSDKMTCGLTSGLKWSLTTHPHSQFLKLSANDSIVQNSYTDLMNQQISYKQAARHSRMGRTVQNYSYGYNVGSTVTPFAGFGFPPVANTSGFLLSNNIETAFTVPSASPLPDNETTEWNIVIKATGARSGVMSIGLAKPTGVPWGKSFLGAEQNSWGVLRTGAVYSLGNSLRQIAAFNDGAIISFRANMTERNCKIWVNGVDYGVVWTHLPSTVYPAVSLSDGAICEIN